MYYICFLTQVYPDANHKPEMALALSDDFRALCSFAPLAEIAAALSDVPELQGVVGEAAAAEVQAAAAFSGGVKDAEEAKQVRAKGR